MKKLFTCVVLFCTVIAVKAQSIISQNGNFTLSGYAEIYYGFDFNRPPDNNRPSFVYSHNRHNEVNLNLGFIKGAYNNGLVRANLALMTGTYANANLAPEPGVLKNIFEANIGVKLSKSVNLWLDAGIFGSHIGFESAISKNDWVLTRDISSGNSPYYDAGAKITYITDDQKWTLVGLYLNGFQRITREAGNSHAAGGLQITYKPTDRLTLNYSNYIGTEGADSVNVTRFYNDFYVIYQATDHFGITAGFDYATQQKAKGSSDLHQVVAPVVIAQYKFGQKWAVAGRYEFFRDPNNVLINNTSPHGFQTSGYSANIDYHPVPNAVIRLEGKTYDSKYPVFTREGQPIKTDPLVTASLAVSF